MNKQLVSLALFATLGVGFAGGYWISDTKAPEPMVEKNASSVERAVLYWRNPMNPAITSPVFYERRDGDGLRSGLR